jgi:acyl-CoA reductase-like NAD-dependent aldehyde dehydrogenase
MPGGRRLRHALGSRWRREEGPLRRQSSTARVFVEPTLVEAVPHMPITCEETFAPILYLFEFDTV